MNLKPILAALLALPSVLLAQEVMLSPSTVLLTESKRADLITVGSGGDGFATFAVTDAFFLQTKDGQLTIASPKGPQNSALSWLRVGPRRFATEPGRSMQVRVAARPPPDLPPGEYRLHLLVANKGTSEPLPSEVKAAAKGKAVVVDVAIVVSRGVRILYRNKVKPEGGRLEMLAQEPEGPNINFGFDVVRLGQTSLIGTYQIFTRMNGKDQDLGREFGVSVYAELDKRRFTTAVLQSDIPRGSTVCARLTFADDGNPELQPVEACMP